MINPVQLPTAPEPPKMPSSAFFSLGSWNVWTRMEIAVGTVSAAARPDMARKTRSMIGSTLTAHRMENIPTVNRPMQNTGFGLYISDRRPAGTWNAANVSVYAVRIHGSSPGVKPSLSPICSPSSALFVREARLPTYRWQCRHSCARRKYVEELCATQKRHE